MPSCAATSRSAGCSASACRSSCAARSSRARSRCTIPAAAFDRHSILARHHLHHRHHHTADSSRPRRQDRHHCHYHRQRFEASRRFRSDGPSRARSRSHDRIALLLVLRCGQARLAGTPAERKSIGSSK
eukprot:6176316-Pleurochrysis_carterae.AAC.4